ncbi:MAG: prepilin-type N-terminal cleavage/methylation domain-containing protein [Proteobacteria bacterium]|nr:prepilin-type N-terminal cleavage/methylation domain-containing protein [Pseudomonadota bacterium]MBU1688078.1 prepilin-type N-terminal cleavage/methylation domain-containing protein [Pseudomonadota bacterium]
MSGKTTEHGFTLLELLIVIIILGIFAATAVPYYLNMVQEAKIAAAKGRMAAIRGGIELAHAKIMVSGVNTGPDGNNPDWPTLEEVQHNELRLATRPEPIQHLQLVRSEIFSNEQNQALPQCNLPDLTPGMMQNPRGVSYRTLEDIRSNPRRANEASCWAYYPGNERDQYGRVVDAIFYINDDRLLTDNIDAAGGRPSSW